MKQFVFVLCVLLSTWASAQKIDLGIKAGVNFATISEANNLSNKTGFVAGAFVGGKFNDNVGFQIDLLYSQQGAKFNASEFNLDYFSLPVVVKVYLVKGLHLQVGPQFGILLDDDTQSAIGETINDIAASNFDFSGVAGLGIELPFGIRADARYQIGFTDVSGQSQFNNGKNNVFTVAVGYSFL